MVDGEGLLHMAQKSLGPINSEINCEKIWKEILDICNLLTLY